MERSFHAPTGRGPSDLENGWEGLHPTPKTGNKCPLLRPFTGNGGADCEAPKRTRVHLRMRGNSGVPSTQFRQGVGIQQDRPALVHQPALSDQWPSTRVRSAAHRPVKCRPCWLWRKLKSPRDSVRYLRPLHSDAGATLAPGPRNSSRIARHQSRFARHRNDIRPVAATRSARACASPACRW